VTANPVLAGFVPGVTVTVSVDESPGRTEFGVAAPTPDGLVVPRTVRDIEVLPTRFSGLVSVMVTGRLFAPPLVPFATVALNEKRLSFGVTSPLVPSSKKAWLAEPPMEERLALNVCAVLVGFVPGVTVTVNSVVFVGATEEGLAAPTPDGFVEPPPHGLAADAVLRGFGAPLAKSVELLSVSVQPLLARRLAVVFVSVAAGDVSEQLAAP